MATATRTQPASTPPSGAEELLRAGGTLPILLVMVEGDHIVDVRVATHAFLTAHLAAGSLTISRGNSCNASAGRSPSSLA